MTTAVVDIAVDTSRTAAHAHPIAPVRPGAARRRAPASTPEILHVATPDAAFAAFAAGSSAICLSPFTGSVDVARRLADAADAAGVVGVVPFVARYHPAVRAARGRVAAGELGMLLTLDCSYLQDALLGADDSALRPTGGPSRAFAEVGSHLCDLMEFVSGHRIARLTARTRRVFDRRGGVAVSGEDIASVLIETDGGALGTVVVSQMAAGHPDALTLQLHGTARSLGFASERPGELRVGGRVGSRLEGEDGDRHTDNAFDAFLAAAYAAVDLFPPRDIPTLRDALRAATLAAAVVESAATGSWVETPYGGA